MDASRPEVSSANRLMPTRRPARVEVGHPVQIFNLAQPVDAVVLAQARRSGDSSFDPGFSSRSVGFKLVAVA